MLDLIFFLYSNQKLPKEHVDRLIIFIITMKKSKYLQFWSLSNVGILVPWACSRGVSKKFNPPPH